MRRWWQGFLAAWKGFSFLMRHRSLWKLAVVPWIVACLSSISVVFSTIYYAPRLLTHVWAMPQDAWILLWYVYAIAFFIGWFLMNTLIAYAVSLVLVTPFYDRLSERVEQIVRPQASETFVWRVFIKDSIASILHSMLSVCLLLAVQLVVFLISLIPVVGVVLGQVLGFIIGTLFLSREMLDGPFSRRRLSFRKKIAIILKDFWLFFGFGTGLFLFLWIPIVQFFLVPFAVTSGALLYVNLTENQE